MTPPPSSASTARRTLRGSGWSRLIERSMSAGSAVRPCDTASARARHDKGRPVAPLATLPSMTLRELGLSPWLLRAFAFAWGAVWGSFVNVVVYRVPREMSVVRPGSHCPACGAPVRAADNVPILSWLLLRGRARCCGARISPRYAVVELLGGVIGLGLLEVLLHTLPGHTPLLRAGAIFLSDFALAMALLAAAFIDAEHMILPDSITLGGALFGLATPGLRGLGYLDVVLGAAAGFVGVWLPLV